MEGSEATLFRRYAPCVRALTRVARAGHPHDAPTPAQIVAHVTERVVHTGSRPSVPQWVSPAINLLLLQCWAMDPAQRPSMRTVRAAPRPTAACHRSVDCELNHK